MQSFQTISRLCCQLQIQGVSPVPHKTHGIPPAACFSVWVSCCSPVDSHSRAEFYFPESLTKFTKYTEFLLLPVSLCGSCVPRLRRGTQDPAVHLCSPVPGILFSGIAHKIHKIHEIPPAACSSVWILCPRLRRGTQQAIDCGKPGSAGAGRKNSRTDCRPAAVLKISDAYGNVRFLRTRPDPDTLPRSQR